MNRTLRRIFVLAVVTLLVMCLGALEVWLAFNVASSPLRFAFGPVILLVAGLIFVGAYLAAHKETGHVLGTTLALATAAAAVFVVSVWKPWHGLTLASLGLSAIGMAVLAAAFSVCYAGNQLCRR